jgi:hypothetical protein
VDAPPPDTWVVQDAAREAVDRTRSRLLEPDGTRELPEADIP